MIDKLNNINTNVQKRAIEENTTKNKKSSSVSVSIDEKPSTRTETVKINNSVDIKKMAQNAPIDLDKVSVIKQAIAKGEYPMDIEKVADALLEAYKDIK